ncbi:cupin domain-containing protein [Paracoccus seriniphilus]|uniref:(S)-ureidoglycine aminohydrolase cupin domain-containing protein n=1 Tax=Paracoccus seriniphilus TaxID=184748 RepID=A0A239Q2V8_9RHOB|nr:cupin domain-containing protein [Paracoccus seriniphilus]WCR16063.1 cupin domain-containing protein [Paracoccus seriniphilus]SNT76891.1 hypothetical protein SAMN05444959_1361 [Paracoccus seriniphilus]
MDIIDFSDEPLESSQRRLADLPDRVVEGDPQHQTELHFRSPDGALIAGTWTSTPGKWHAFTDRDEFCHIISGRCALISSDGKRREFVAGQSFLIPNGFRGYWEIIETTTKHFVIREH